MFSSKFLFRAPSHNDLSEADPDMAYYDVQHRLILDDSSETDEDSEHSALLRRTTTQHYSSFSQASTRRPRPLNPPPPPPAEADEGLNWRERHLTALLAFLICCLAVMVFLQEAPITQVYESIICSRYYEEAEHVKLAVRPGVGDKDGLCKIEPVQAELAWVLGIQKLTESLFSIAVAVPFARLSDRVGRRPIIIVSATGLFLYYFTIFTICWFGDVVPLRFVWLAPTWMLVGGGSTVASAVIYCMISDTVPLDSITNRYYFLQAAMLGATAFGRTASSVIMEKSVWWSLYIGLTGLFFAVLLVLALPETIHRGLARRQYSAVPQTADGADDIQAQVELNQSEPRGFYGFRKRFAATCASSKALLSRHHFILVMLLLEFLTSFGERVANVILLYTSKRYNLSFSQANYFNSYLTVVNIILLLGILPLSGWFLLAKLKLSIYNKELSTATASVLLFMGGCIIIGLGREVTSAVVGITLYGLGHGALANYRSIMVMFAPPDQASLCHTLFSIFRDLGEAASFPIYSLAFGKGIELGGHWIGLPFQLSAACFGIVMVMLGLVWLRRTKPDLSSPASP